MEIFYIESILSCGLYLKFFVSSAHTCTINIISQLSFHSRIKKRIKELPNR